MIGSSTTPAIEKSGSSMRVIPPSQTTYAVDAHTQQYTACAAYHQWSLSVHSMLPWDIECKADQSVAHWKFSNTIRVVLKRCICLDIAHYILLFIQSKSACTGSILWSFNAMPSNSQNFKGKLVISRIQLHRQRCKALQFRTLPAGLRSFSEPSKSETPGHGASAPSGT